MVSHGSGIAEINMSTLKNIIKSALETDAKLDESQYPSSITTYSISRERFTETAKLMKIAGARLVSEWATDETQYPPPALPPQVGEEKGGGRGFGIYACYAKDSEYLIVKTSAPVEDPTFPSLTKKFIPAYRFERQIRSLMGVIPLGHPDSRPWIKHEDWEENVYPLRKTFDASKSISRVKCEYQWIRAEGEGVYEIPVGPVHAGIIEPGHFRFQAVGEDILNLEEKLGYVHKGIEKRFESISWEDGAKLAGRVSGDTTVAHSLCYCRTVESMRGCNLPERALWLRALMLERERIANHLGDIGAICNDAAFAFMLYQLTILKERILRTNYKLLGHRFIMDKIIPGGVTVDINSDAKNEILSEMDWLTNEFERLVIIYDENSSLDDRLRDTGKLTAEKARIKLYVLSDISEDPAHKKLTENAVGWLEFHRKTMQLTDITNDPDKPLALKYDTTLLQKHDLYKLCGAEAAIAKPGTGYEQKDVMQETDIRFNGKLKRFFTMAEFEKVFGKPDSIQLLKDEAPCVTIFGTEAPDDKYLYKDGSRFETSKDNVAVDEFWFRDGNFITYKGNRIDANTTMDDIKQLFPTAVSGRLGMDKEGKLWVIQLREDSEGISDGHIKIFFRDGKISFMHWWFPC